MCIHTQWCFHETLWTLFHFLRYIMGFNFLGPFSLNDTCHLLWPMRWEEMTFQLENSGGKVSYLESYRFWKHASLFCYKRLICTLLSRTVLWCFPSRPSLTTDTSIILFTTMILRRQMSTLKITILSWKCLLMSFGMISSCFLNLLPVWYFRVTMSLEWPKGQWHRKPERKCITGIILLRV